MHIIHCSVRYSSNIDAGRDPRVKSDSVISEGVSSEVHAYLTSNKAIMIANQCIKTNSFMCFRPNCFACVLFAGYLHLWNLRAYLVGR